MSFTKLASEQKSVTYVPTTRVLYQPPTAFYRKSSCSAVVVPVKSYAVILWLEPLGRVQPGQLCLRSPQVLQLCGPDSKMLGLF